VLTHPVCGQSSATGHREVPPLLAKPFLGLSHFSQLAAWTRMPQFLALSLLLLPLLTVHMGYLYTPDQLAGQLALKVHRALRKCPFLRNIHTQALSQVIERPVKLAPFFSLVYISARDNRTEFRRCLEQLLRHLYRQQALHILARPNLISVPTVFDPESLFSKPLHAHLSCCFVRLTGIRRQI